MPHPCSSPLPIRVSDIQVGRRIMASYKEISTLHLMRYRAWRSSCLTSISFRAKPLLHRYEPSRLSTLCCLALVFYGKLPQHERFQLVVKCGEYACPDGNTRRSLRFEEVWIETHRVILRFVPVVPPSSYKKSTCEVHCYCNSIDVGWSTADFYCFLPQLVDFLIQYPLPSPTGIPMNRNPLSPIQRRRCIVRALGLCRSTQPSKILR